jgi:hypothetical protein
MVRNADSRSRLPPGADRHEGGFLFTARPMHERPPPFEVVVNRRIDRPAASVTSAATQLLPGADVPLPGGRLNLTDRYEYRHGPGGVVWSVQGRFADSCTRLPAGRVEVEIASGSAPWGCELLVRPCGRFLRRWGARRQARYFRLAHDAADALARLLGETPMKGTADDHGPDNDRSARPPSG